MIQTRKIILGVCGGIAAYKSAELVRLLKKAGAEVQVVMTSDASRFITPLTLGTLSEREVLCEIFPENEDGSWTKHVGLGTWADLFLIAPATAQTIAKLANGFSDSMLTATALAARCPIMVFPAMDHDMYLHPATRKNLDVLEEYGYIVRETGYGELASGLVGHGRLLEPEQILQAVETHFAEAEERTAGTLDGLRVLVTAGPTREALDPVRFLSNHSTGTMGFEIARAAEERGATVTLIAGPTPLDTPKNVRRIDVTTAAEMQKAVLEHADADLVFMAAAVADYAPANHSPEKVKKGGSEEDLTLRLTRTEDILRALGDRKKSGQTLVGFALETENAVANAERKLTEKNLDLIVLNDLKDEGAGFGTETNRVTLLFANGTREELPLLPKSAVARKIVDAVSEQRTVA